MTLLKCDNSIDNAVFLADIIRNFDVDKNNYCRVISDLDLIPSFHGDYSGIGRTTEPTAAYIFLSEIQRQ